MPFRSQPDHSEPPGFFMLAPEPYLVTDALGAIIDMNLAAQRFFRENLVAMRRKPLQVFISPDVRREFRSRLNAMIPGDILTTELKLSPLGGDERVVTVSGLMHVTEGQSPRVYWLFRDITDRVRAEHAVRQLNEQLEARVAERTAALQESLAALQKANAAKDDFLSMVSHELRTPLTVALGNARLLHSHLGNLPTEDLEQSLADIVESGEKLQHLIENLMVLARAERLQGVDIEPVLLQRLVPDVVEEVLKAMPEEACEVDIPDHLPPVAGVPAYVEQVVMNLLTNAAKYGTEGTPIRITSQAGRRSVAVCVTNEGAGIPESERRTIFQPFYRARETSKTRSGMGIGLTVVRRLMEAQGGRIWLARSGEAETTFAFNLQLWNGGE